MELKVEKTVHIDLDLLTKVGMSMMNNLYFDSKDRTWDTFVDDALSEYLYKYGSDRDMTILFSGVSRLEILPLKEELKKRIIAARIAEVQA